MWNIFNFYSFNFNCNPKYWLEPIKNITQLFCTKIKLSIEHLDVTKLQSFNMKTSFKNIQFNWKISALSNYLHKFKVNFLKTSVRFKFPNELTQQQRKKTIREILSQFKNYFHFLTNIQLVLCLFSIEYKEQFFCPPKNL